MSETRTDDPTPTTNGNTSSSDVGPSGADGSRAEEHWNERMSQAGIPPIYQEAHLSSNCQRYRREERKQKALEAAEAFSENGTVEQRGATRHCLLIAGDYGTGKTWLATAALKRLMYRMDTRAVRWVRFYDFIRDIQNCYAPGASATVRAVLGRYQNADILLLDDVGDLKRDEQSVDRQQLFYEVVDTRCAWKRATIITTNLSGGRIADQFGERTFERIKEMSALVRMDGRNYRDEPLP